MPPRVITLLTDFGTADPFVGIMKGVMLGINPDARLVDLTHAVPAQQVLIGALILRNAVAFFPGGTIHVAVVDPGVGTARRPILIETDTGFLVGPDNGLLSLAAAATGRHSVRLIANEQFFCHPVSQTFHGRDIFAPVAGHLSKGVAPDAFGPATESTVELTVPALRRTPSGLTGEVIYVDHFGNLITNVDAAVMGTRATGAGAFPASLVSVRIAHGRVAPLVTAYAAVPEGAPLAIIGSWGTLEIAVRNGSAAKTFAAGPGTPVTVVVESRDV